jgi:hypothetical protein
MKFLDAVKSDKKADEAWTCDKCHRPTKLQLVSIGLRSGKYRFRSECCRYPCSPTKAKV